MAKIKIKIDTSKYKVPTEEDINSAKEYILRRDEMAEALENRVDYYLANAAERIVVICYRYGVDPKKLIFSSAFNSTMMNEISDVMDEIEEEIYSLIFEYSTRATNDKDIINMLVLWMTMLGRGDRNLRDTLDTYLFKAMKDWEAAIAAMTYMGVSMSDAVVKLKTHLHSVYTMPEVLTAFRRRQEFTATYIRLGGVQSGAVGISNNGSTNVVNMVRTTLQMVWMRAQLLQWQEDESIAGYFQLRGSTYNCDLCDEEVGFHLLEKGQELPPYPHPSCQCYRVPIINIENQ